MQLFAIIAKQDNGVDLSEREFVRTFLRQQVNDVKVEEYISLFDKKFGYKEKQKSESQEKTDKAPKKERKLTSVRDSVKTLGLSKKINKTLTQKQKVVVLIRLYELVNSDKNFTEQRMAIINTIADVFNIPSEEINDIETFVTKENLNDLDKKSILLITNHEIENENCKIIESTDSEGTIIILQINSTDLHFFRYIGTSDIFVNGLQVSNSRIHTLAPGSTLRLSKGKPYFYSDVVSKFMDDKSVTDLSFVAEDIVFTFPNGGIGLRTVSLSENQGKLVGIMGSSGAGKTTLLNVLSGIETPSSGRVLINGVDLHKEKEKLEGVIGYIPQDDLLIEELTVFQNLYYNAKLCFKHETKENITERVNKTLKSLGLFDRKDLKVGSPLNKLISGGQRKRLNIALELIREPSVLFVDEPTSGLSSRDSENIMSLLRELSLKGKLIFVVIHQPSSDIYKMFDKMVILDTGGYLIYYGNPVESVMYFKQLDAQINSDEGECITCGNVNSETIFNIIEAHVVDEYGQYTENRKILPQKWEKLFKENIKLDDVNRYNTPPPKALDIPSWISQIKIFVTRDFISKIGNKQYVILNLLESPILAFVLAYIIRYIANPNSSVYIFRENENIAPYVFMSIVVALFIGLTVSAEEIFRDRKILKRESFLNLSKSSYLVSKIIILFVLSAVQTFLFVLIGNYVLGIQDMNFAYWIALYSIATFSNILGLNISAAFNSAVTIYILIPLIMIPQMILGGAMFSFDKLNRDIVSIDKVPLIAEVMASKWIYEALLVKQFKDNEFQKVLYDVEKEESNANFKQVYFIPELLEISKYCYDNIGTENDSARTILEQNLSLLRKEIKGDKFRSKSINVEFANMLTIDSLNGYYTFLTKEYLNEMSSYYMILFSKANKQKQKIINYLLDKDTKRYRAHKDNYYNESISDIVKKVYEKNKIIQFKDKLVQQVDPIFLDPKPSGTLGFRSHLFAPRKYFLGQYYDTFWFNVLVVWSMTIALYITLYFDALKKLLTFFEKKSFKNIFK